MDYDGLGPGLFRERVVEGRDLHEVGTCSSYEVDGFFYHFSHGLTPVRSAGPTGQAQTYTDIRYFFSSISE